MPLGDQETTQDKLNQEKDKVINLTAELKSVKLHLYIAESAVNRLTEEVEDLQRRYNAAINPNNGGDYEPSAK